MQTAGDTSFQGLTWGILLFNHIFFWLVTLSFTHDFPVCHWLELDCVGGSKLRGTAGGGAVSSDRKTKERRVLTIKR